eukprot:3318531-Pyramimonas_sp.AAC.1
MDQAVDDAATMMVCSATDHWRRSNLPMDRYDVTRMLLAGVHLKVKEAAGKWGPDQEARDWLTGGPY